MFAFSVAGVLLTEQYARVKSRQVFAWYESGSTLAVGDVFMLTAIVVCGLGYAEGAKHLRSIGGWQAISWTLLISLPIMVALSMWSLPVTFENIGAPAWVGMAYVSVFSMLDGFVFWYRGRAMGCNPLPAVQSWTNQQQKS